MDSRKRVSIIVPVYQVAEYLNKCVLSILDQTYPSLEIILVDDGSTDGSSDMCDNYANKDSRIVVIHKENGGLSSARNAGLEIAKGDYVAFVDSDDYIHPSYIETLLNCCESHGCDIAVCNYMTVREDIVPLPLNRLEKISYMNSRDALHALTVDRYLSFIVCWNKLYKRNLFNEIRFPDGKIHEDEFVTHHLLFKSEKTAWIGQYLYYYRKRADSIMSRPYSKKNFDRIYGTMDRLQLLEREGLEEEYRSVIKRINFLIEQAERYCEDAVDSDSVVMLDDIKKKCEKYKIYDISTPSVVNTEKYVVDTTNISGKMVVYGAGDIGRAIIKELGNSFVCGCVDNLWYKINDLEIEIKPVYELLSLEYDYVCITQKNPDVRNELTQLFLSWGIPESKIKIAILQNGKISFSD